MQDIRPGQRYDADVSLRMSKIPRDRSKRRKKESGEAENRSGSLSMVIGSKGSVKGTRAIDSDRRAAWGPTLLR